MRARAAAAVTLVALMGPGCATLPPRAFAEARKTDYFATPRELPPAVLIAIERGHVITGMDAEQAWVVLGDPLRKRRFVSGGEAVEVWLYPGYKVHQDQVRGDKAGLFRLVFREGVLILVEPLI